MVPAVAHVYRYAGASALVAGTTPALNLVTSGEPGTAPVFFRGKLTRPRATAVLLRALSRIVGTRFFVPPGMLQRILLAADPVVTCGGGLLRFEGFSACASVYARVDLTPGAYDGDVTSRGTTNVDFNAPMRAALGGVTDGDGLSFAIGADRLELERSGATVVERKVSLPIRWLKGLVEVQAYQARMKPRVTLPAPEALRFVRALPRASTSRHEQWLVPSGNTVRLSMRRTHGAVRVSGTERLRVLEAVAPLARSLRVLADDDGAASAWELDLGALRFTLVLSADVWRGFSGEGQALTALAALRRREVLVARARAQLAWQAALRPDELAARIGATPEDAFRVLLALGARGLVGFDLAAGAFFHRELPFDLGAVESMQPRLTAARELLAGGGIELGSERAGVVELLVRGTGVTHRVRLTGDDTRCTCAWFAKHQGARGPCKHVLAAQLFVEDRR